MEQLLTERNLQLIQLKIQKLKKSQILFTDNKLYECNTCKDTGIELLSKNYAKICICREKAIYNKKLKESKLYESFASYVFDNFHTKTEWHKNIKTKCQEYAENFSDNSKSIMFLGLCGTGKTHLATSIANILMRKNTAVLFMQYIDDMPELINLKMTNNYELYQKKMDLYKNCKVLFLDELFKREITEANIKIIYEIVNFRYRNNAQMIITSERSLDFLLKLDEAIASRLMEMSKGFIHVMKCKNYRLGG